MLCYAMLHHTFSLRYHSTSMLQHIICYADLWSTSFRVAIAVFFFHAGNEIPVEEHGSHTGLSWKLVLKFNALVVFAEHRCEVKSTLHNLTDINYFSYLSSNQTLEYHNSLLTKTLNATFPLKTNFNRVVTKLCGSSTTIINAEVMLITPTCAK